MQRKDDNDRMDTYDDTCSGHPLGQGAGLGEPLVWPYKAELRRVNTTCLLSSKYLLSHFNNVIKPRKSKATSECGLLPLPATGAGTTVFPALVRSERECLSVPVHSGKFLVLFFSVSSTCPGMRRTSLCGFPPSLLASPGVFRTGAWPEWNRFAIYFLSHLQWLGEFPSNSCTRITREKQRAGPHTWSEQSLERYVHKVAIGTSSRRVMDLHHLEPATSPSGNSSPLGTGIQSTLIILSHLNGFPDRKHSIKS